MTSRPWKRVFWLLCPLALLTVPASCTGKRETVRLHHSKSLAPLIKVLAQRFEANNPHIAISTEAPSDLEALWKVLQGEEAPDLMAVADSRLIQWYLIPKHTSRAYAFLGDEVVLAYLDPEPLLPARWSNPEDLWLERLASGRHPYGTLAPHEDPLGYFSLLTWQLAEIHYRRSGLYRRLLLGQHPSWIHSRLEDLAAGLRGGRLDFAFLFRSTAVQEQFQFIELPPQVSLGEAAYEGLYSRVQVSLAEAPGRLRLRPSGAPIRYGVGLLSPARVPARRLLEYLLTPEAQQLARELGYSSVPPSPLHLEPAN